MEVEKHQTNTPGEKREIYPTSWGQERAALQELCTSVIPVNIQAKKLLLGR